MSAYATPSTSNDLACFPNRNPESTSAQGVTIPSSSYGNSHVSGQARVVLGNVATQINNPHYHYYLPAERSTVSNSRQENAKQRQKDLPVVETRYDVPENSISDYDAAYSTWVQQQARLEGTCEWLFRTKEYIQWMNDGGPRILICAGTVGCGKSILAGKVVQQLHESRATEDRVVLSYFVDPSSNQKPSFLQISLALIKQMYSHHKTWGTDLPFRLQEQLRNAFLQRSVLPVMVAESALLSFLSLCPSTIIIDGLDILAAAELQAFIAFVNKASKDVNLALRLLITCRETLEDGIQLDAIQQSTVLSITLKHIRADIANYIDHEIRERQAAVPIIKDPALLQEVATVLKANSVRMFLWVKLQLNCIWCPAICATDSDIRKQLSSLPQGLESTYIACLQAIESKGTDKAKAIALASFQWIATARQPMTPDQLREVVSIDPEDIPLKKSTIINLAAVDYCANLIVHNKTTNHVEFVHPSVKELLLQTSKLREHGLADYALNLLEGHCMAAYCCLRYIVYLRSNDKIILAGRQAIRTEITKPTVALVADNLLRGKFRSLFHQQDRKSAAAKTKPTIATFAAPKTEDAISLPTRQYILSGWLWHVKEMYRARDQVSYFRNNDYIFELFEQLATYKSQFCQPWASNTIDRLDHWRQMLLYAVMECHEPLLNVIHKQAFRDKSIAAIFRESCPGTESGWLHIASAMGHDQLLATLIELCPELMADGQGKSAAAVAIEHRQDFTLGWLLGHPRASDWPWRLQLQNQYGAFYRYEYLLQVASRCGNQNAVDILLGPPLMDSATMPQDLRAMSTYAMSTAAVYEACKAGHTDLAIHLLSYGASPECCISFEDASKPEYRGVINLFMQNLLRTSYHYALQERSHIALDCLLTTRSHLGPLPSMIAYLVAEIGTTSWYDPKMDAAPFLSVLFHHSIFDMTNDPSQEVNQDRTWLKGVYNQLCNQVSWRPPRSSPYLHRVTATNGHSFAPQGLTQMWRDILALALKVDTATFRSLLPCGNVPISAVSCWLGILPDDVVIMAIKCGILKNEFLFSIETLLVLARRESTRGLKVARQCALKAKPPINLQRLIELGDDEYLIWQSTDSVKERLMDVIEGEEGDEQQERMLNWPAGHGNGKRIRSCILLAVYAWNYRLGRKFKRPFSSADTWYLGANIAEELRRKRPLVKKPGLLRRIPRVTELQRLEDE